MSLSRWQKLIANSTANVVLWAVWRALAVVSVMAAGKCRDARELATPECANRAFTDRGAKASRAHHRSLEPPPPASPACQNPAPPPAPAAFGPAPPGTLRPGDSVRHRHVAFRSSRPRTALFARPDRLIRQNRSPVPRRRHKARIAPKDVDRRAL